jgi:hypothetical protein
MCLTPLIAFCEKGAEVGVFQVQPIPFYSADIINVYLLTRLSSR